MGDIKTIELPLTFNQIELKDISRWNEKAFNHLHLVHIFSGISKEVLLTLPVEAVAESSRHLQQILSEPIQEFRDSFKIDKQEYGFIPNWGELTAGEYVDMSKYLEDPLVNATKLMAIWYRPVADKEGDRYTIEAYNGTKNHDVFNSTSASNFYGALTKFHEYNTRLRHNFAAVFGDPSRTPDDDDEVQRRSTLDSFTERWAWYDFLMGFIEGDVTRLNDVTELPITQLLAHRAYTQDKHNLNNDNS